MARDKKVPRVHDPRSRRLIVAADGTTLKEANDIIWEHKLNSLPIVDDDGRLMYLVFRKDYDSHKANPNELLDQHKRYMVGAGINTRDYAERVPAARRGRRRRAVHRLLRGLLRVAEAHPRLDPRELRRQRQGRRRQRRGRARASASWPRRGADFVKVGIGGGSICITRETKGIGRGQATALIEVCAGPRRVLTRRPASMCPSAPTAASCYDYHMTLALAMGADFMMLGRYFARFDESPTQQA